MSQPEETAHRFERVIESLPIQMDPLNRVRDIMFEAGSSLADPAVQFDRPDQPARPTPSSERNQRLRAPARATVKDSTHPELDPSDFMNEDIDIETLKTIYKDLGIV